MNYVVYFEEQIQNQQKTIRSFKLTTFILILIGVGIIMVSMIIQNEKGVGSDLIKFGSGVFMAALGVLPYKEIAPRRERIISYAHLRTSFEDYEKLTHEERQLLLQMATDAIRENLKR
jgi:hypothetical protein